MSRFLLPNLLPKTLLSRMVWVIMLLMMVILTGFSSYTGYRDQRASLKNIESQLTAIAYQVAASSTSYLILDNHAELEDLVARFMEYPSLDAIEILSPSKESIVVRHRADAGHGVIGMQDETELAHPPSSSKSPFLSGQHMEIWYPVEAGNLLAWVHIRFSLESYYQRIHELWINIGIALLITLLVLYVAVRILLRNNIKRLHDATEHARNLLSGEGQQLDSDGLAQEVGELVSALNQASYELNIKHDEVERGQGLLSAISTMQKDYIAQTGANVLFSSLLQSLLDITDSEYGFIAEVMHSKSGQPYLRTHTISNIAWSEYTQELYRRQAQTGFEFYNMDSLFGTVIKNEKTLIANDPMHHPNYHGLPMGHPPITSYIGLPFFDAGRIVGIISLANRKAGYSEELAELLKPVLTTCGQISEAYKSEHKRRETEERLRESENMLRQVLNTIPTRVFWKDMDGVYMGCNYNFAQDAGFSSELEVIGKNDYEMPWSPEAPLYRQDDKRVIANGIPRLRYEEVQTTPSGEQVWLRTSKIPLRNVDETVIGILGSYDDITEEKHKEIKILESERRLAMAQRIAQVGNWEADLVTKKDMWSDEVYRILGVDRHTPPCYETFFNTIHSDDAERIQRLIDEHTAQREAYEFESRIQSQDGVEKVIAVRAQYDFNEQGEMVRIYGTMQDITERKRMEKLKDDFISTVSHELRTPLTSIKGSLGLLTNLLHSASKEKLQNLLSIAQNNTERLLFLINDILDISKMESGHIVFHFQPLDIVAIAREAITNNTSYANDVSLRLIEPPQEVVWVNADRDRLLQVIYNLLSNAAKFSHPGGVVDVRLAASTEEVSLSVQDYGIGISEEFIPKLFEKFTQADSSSTRHTGGTGLGLSISKSIIERHGGRIEVESAVGQGTSFTIVLPAHKVVGVEQQLPKARTEGARVLICEDDPDVAVLLKEMLESEGYDCDVASSAAQASQMLDAGDYEAMTLDIMLPGKDGISFLTELRQDPRYRALNVIIVSVKAGEARNELHGTALGVSDWLSKPIDESRLLSSMSRLVRGHQGQARVLHVEDDPDLVRVVSSLLEGIASVETAKSLQQARALLQQHDYDLLLLDLNLPDGHGLELLQSLQGAQAELPVVIFSSEDASVDAVEQVKAVLLKSRADNLKLVETIRQLLPRPGSETS